MNLLRAEPLKSGAGYKTQEPPSVFKRDTVALTAGGTALIYINLCHEEQREDRRK